MRLYRETSLQPCANAVGVFAGHSSILPIGLINQQSWCFMNATLQCFMGLSQFVTFLESISQQNTKTKSVSYAET